jgi:hypothetical protein
MDHLTTKVNGVYDASTYTVRPSVMAGYLASYYDVNRQKVGERIVTK